MVLATGITGESRERYVWLMHIVNVVADQSTCPRAKVGAVIRNNGSIIAVSYNGAPSGTPHCRDTGCTLEDDHCITATHAEINAIAGCAKNGISTEGGEIIINYSPCHACAKAILRAGIKRVVYNVEYDHVGIEILWNAGIEVYQL